MYRAPASFAISSACSGVQWFHIHVVHLRVRKQQHINYRQLIDPQGSGDVALWPGGAQSEGNPNPTKKTRVVELFWDLRFGIWLFGQLSGPPLNNASACTVLGPSSLQRAYLEGCLPDVS